MNQVVTDFIRQKDQEYQEAKIKERNALLVRVGLAKKIYKEDENTDGLSRAELKRRYPYSEYVQNIIRVYRWEYPEFTDEEIEEIKKAQERLDEVTLSIEIKDQSDESEVTSKLASFLMILAVAVYLIAFIAGISLGKKDVLVGSGYSRTKEEFSIAIALVYWGVGLVSGTLILALSNIVENLKHQTALLRAMVNKK